MRLLFYKEAFAWPRSSGHDVHTFNMMRAMARLGARVGLVTRRPSPPPALDGATLDLNVALDDVELRPVAASGLSGLQERFRSYWGVDSRHIATCADIARQFRADVVVVSGLDVLPMLGGIASAARVWYAADEWFWHHVSQIKATERASWSNARTAVVKGLYERAYASCIDRAWVVSAADERAMRWVAGVRNVDVVPNGVDFDYYQPAPGEEEQGDTAVFWGRLDFGPNIQALQWFCRHVWPAVVARRPAARFTILGFNPGPEVRELASWPGIILKPDLPDLRREVGRHAVVVLPFVSGGGIKNKLLEAAAMGKPIVCSRRTRRGLNGAPPLVDAAGPDEWRAAICRLWDRADERHAAGTRVRRWVVAEHGWERPARQALEALQAGASNAAPRAYAFTE